MINQFITYYGIQYISNNMLYLFDRAFDYCITKYKERTNAFIREKNKIFTKSIAQRNIENKNKISVDEFEWIVRLFKQSFNLKSIRQAFSLQDFGPFDKNYDKRLERERLQLMDIFLANPVIRKYLSRKHVKTNGFELILDSKYERSLYRATLREEEMIPYRTVFLTWDVKEKDAVLEPSKLFYLCGSLEKAKKRNFIIEKLKVDPILNDSDRIDFTLEGDIYNIADKVSSISKKLKNNIVLETSKSLSYFVWPGSKDDHAYLTAAVFNVTTGEAICVLLLNSWHSEWYSNYLKVRFRMNNETTPFIDCSIDVQTDENDGNCTLYGSVFGRALVELIHKESEETDKVFKDYQEDKVEETIQEFVRSKIVEYLPEYYYENP